MTEEGKSKKNRPTNENDKIVDSIYVDSPEHIRYVTGEMMYGEVDGEKVLIIEVSVDENEGTVLHLLLNKERVEDLIAVATFYLESIL